MRLSPLALALIAAALAVPAAERPALASDQVPTFDVRPSCRGGSDTEAALKSCLQSEEDARKQLVADWSKWTAKQRQGCIAEAGTEQPSYVELLTCLQIDKEVTTLPNQKIDLGPLRKID
ncbi:hypothetical protein [Rhodoplanes azumiensis]|uniref:Lysozyme inhibitor LprI N-terminal domain-containing protein n=1 Tax=Rhodoplanes azumiensis TaxID=1897628 RepID=A0ABW5AQK7_9BRAD